MRINLEKLKFVIWQLLAIILYCNLLFSNKIKQNNGTDLAILNFVIQVAIMIALSLLLAPKPKKPKQPKPTGIEQFDVPTAEEGRPIQVLFGKRYVASPNVVWYGDLRSVPIMG